MEIKLVLPLKKSLTLHICKTSNPPDNETPRVQFTQAHCALRRGDRKNGAIKFDKARFHISRGDKSQEGHLPGTRPTTSSFCSKSSSCDPAFSRSAASHCWSRSASPSADCCAQLFTLLSARSAVRIVDALAPRPPLSASRYRSPANAFFSAHDFGAPLGLTLHLRARQSRQRVRLVYIQYCVAASSLTSRRVRVCKN